VGSYTASGTKAVSRYIASVAKAFGSHMASGAKAVGSYIDSEARAFGSYIASGTKAVGSYIDSEARVFGSYIAVFCLSSSSRIPRICDVSLRMTSFHLVPCFPTGFVL
jgi:hypothetical protein